MEKIKNILVIQSRYNSSRLPGKILLKCRNKTLLSILIKRLKNVKNIDKIVVAIGRDKNYLKIVQECKKINVEFFIGSELDVIDRFYKLSKKYKPQNIVRITSDCPLVDYQLIDKMINIHIKYKYDYTSNTIFPTFPDGYDVEIFKFAALKKAWKISRNFKFLREHVTTYIKFSNNFYKKNIRNVKNLSFLRLTIDYLEDYKLIKIILNKFKNINNFSLKDVQTMYKKNKNIFKINSMYYRNYKPPSILSGQKVWKKAKEVIPGGTMLFSKNPDLFLPDKWPAYFSKVKGCKIWDLDGKMYYDLSFMGVGTNILGYANNSVDKAVINSIKKGNMSTLNNEYEVLLAEKLISIHPWSNMAKFTRSGGEANAVSVRIARAATTKKNIAVCGYHGWHDWYLSANIKSKNNLNNHLMKNLPIGGVPKELKNSIFVFEYNDYDSLKKIVNKNNIGIIKMEVSRNHLPKNNFLKKIRKLCDKKNIILIFDECTSGFRQCLGGLHKIYGVNPDILILGKALGNGYAINAIIGKKEIMKFANNSFISSTFWTEKIGYVAALKTIEIMKKTKSWIKITKLGKLIKKKWKLLAKRNHLDIDIMGLDQIPLFKFKSPNNLKYKTFITQEMLKNNILASNVIYVSISHDLALLNRYFKILDKIFRQIYFCEKNRLDINLLLEQDVCRSGLRG